MAMISTILVAFNPYEKGGAIHKLLGRMGVGLMLIVAISSFSYMK